MNTTSAVEREKAVEYGADGVKGKVVYPDNVPETIRHFLLPTFT